MTIDEERLDDAPTSSITPPTERVDGSGEKRAPDGRKRPDSRGSQYDDRRRKRGSQDRSGMAGYGDGVERATCVLYRHTLPPEFPVHHRAGLATSRPIEVDRRRDAVLLCDENHEGICMWPDGELVEKRLDSMQSLTSDVTPDVPERNAAEEPTSAEPDESGDDQDWDGSGVTDQERGNEG
jgi:hypothetical protein